MVVQGYIGHPNSGVATGYLYLIDSTHLKLAILYDTVNLYKYTCHQLDSLGLQLSTYGLNCTCDSVSVGMNEPHKQKGGSFVSLNPFNQYTYITIEDIYLPVNITLYDVLGNERAKIKATQTTTRLERANLSAGVYILKITTNNQIFTQKLIIN